jgi:hypothetical protein
MILLRKCTASLDGQRRARVRVALFVAPLLTLLLSQVSALADIELGHIGLTGRHRLADMYDSPGAVCDVVLPGADSLGETWVRVNPPVMFARDRTPDVDEQYVGWRATVSALNEESGAWRIVRRSATTKAVASDGLASYFNGQGWLAGFPLSRATYSVTVEMLWYNPADSREVEGRAMHVIEHFMVVLRHHGETMTGRTSSVCRAPR